MRGMQRNVEIVAHGVYKAVRNFLVVRCRIIYTELRGPPFRNLVGLICTLARVYISLAATRICAP